MSQGSTLDADAAAAPSARKRRAARIRKPRKPAADIPTPVLWGVGLAGAGALLALAGLVATREVELIADPYDPQRLLVYALLVVGPLSIFWALARAMRMGLFWLFGAASWAAFGYLLIFVKAPPLAQAAAVHYSLFLGLMGLALVSLLTPPLYALGWAIYSQRLRRHDLGRAIRQAVLAAMYIVLLIGMNLFGVFNWLNALLLFVVFALAEFFFLART